MGLEKPKEIRDKPPSLKDIKEIEMDLSYNMKTLGPDHPDVATLWRGLAKAWHTLGEYNKAIENYHNRR